MVVQVFRVLGLAWVGSGDLVELTKAGKLLLKSSDPAQVLSRQIERYQFYNPSVASTIHREIKLHPLPFIAEVLVLLQPQVITPREYELFIARAKSHDDVEGVAEQIETWRSMSVDEQENLIERLDSYMIGGVGRSSMRNTIALDRPYATAAWALSRLLIRDDAGALAFAPAALRQYRQYLRAFDADHAYIEFRTEKDWIAYMGDPDLSPTKETALDYYVSVGDVGSAVAVKKAQDASAREVRNLKEMLIAERQLEDCLEHNIDAIGGPLGMSLRVVKGGRQYPTTVGPIDLLCRERSGKYVVVELKKNRAADKVFGQVSRYMGWVRSNLAGGKPVLGVIVARNIDDKLKAAATGGAVRLVKFTMKFGAETVS